MLREKIFTAWSFSHLRSLANGLTIMQESFFLPIQSNPANCPPSRIATRYRPSNKLFLVNKPPRGQWWQMCCVDGIAAPELHLGKAQDSSAPPDRTLNFPKNPPVSKRSGSVLGSKSRLMVHGGLQLGPNGVLKAELFNLQGHPALQLFR